MGSIHVKRFSAPDERRPFVDKGGAEVLHFDQGAIGRGVFQPGWQWSKHVKPIAGTKSCESGHTCFCVSGRMHIELDSGEGADVSPGDVVIIPPGHDAWTLGDETCVMLDFSGMENYARERKAARPESQPNV